MRTNFLITLLIFSCSSLQIEAQSEESYYFKFKNSHTNYSALYLQAQLEQSGLNNVSIIDPFLTNDSSINRIFEIQVGQLNQVDDEQFKSICQRIPGFEYVEGIPKHEFFYTPNDYGTQQYNLDKIQAKLAWDVSKGDTGIVVAVVDDAVELTHPDLDGNIWRNWSEIPNNSIDDDGNGYIDDVNGWDAADNDNNPNPVSTANANYHAHGTHCAGIVSSETDNNSGIASIGFKVKIMPVKIGYEYYNPWLRRNVIGLRNAYRGVDYAIKNKANVISMSWGRGAGGSRITEQLLFNVARSRGIVCVAAAGNSNTNVSSFFPASYNHVISVASSTSTDSRSSFSNYGSGIDVTAPGSGIYSTVPKGGYAFKSGTSMACPLVAGLCALMKSQNPSSTASEIINCLQSTCDNIDAQNPLYIGQLGSGRINANRALRCMKPINAEFSSNYLLVCPGDSVQFFDESTPTATSWSWSFPGASPNSSTIKNPKVRYNIAGNFSATLIATNTKGSDTITKMALIKVAKPTISISGPKKITLGESALLSFSLAGNPTFRIVLEHGTEKDTIYTDDTLYVMSFKPIVDTKYKILSFKDTSCFASVLDSLTVLVDTVKASKSTLSQGLMVYYNFDNNSLNQVNNHSHLSSVGTASFVTSKDSRFGKAFKSDGINYLRGNMDSLKFEEYTFSLWTKITKLPPVSSGRVLFDIGGYNGDHLIQLNNNLTSINKPFGILGWYGGGYFASAYVNRVQDSIMPDTGRWYHVVYMKTKDSIKIYVNCKWQDSEYEPLKPRYSTDALRYVTVGARYNGSIKYEGLIDEVRVYNRVLTEEEIQELGGCQRGKENICINPDSVQKISNLHGGFGSILSSNSDFGYRTINPGDIDKDGVQDLVVSAPHSNGNKGAIHVLMLNKDNTIKSRIEIAENVNGFNTTLNSDELLGFGLAPLGDFNNDGIPDIAIGSRSSDGAVHAGAIYICYLDTNGKVKSHQKISKTTGGLNGSLLNAYSNFGISIDTLGDFDNDGIMDLVVGGYTDNTGGSNTGAAWLVYLNANGTAKNTIKLSKNTSVLGSEIEVGSNFGLSVANIGDINTDGVTDLAISSFSDNTGGTDRGALFIIKMKSDGSVYGVTKNTSLNNLEFIYHDDYHFGIDMQFIADGTNSDYAELLMGCYKDNTGGTDKGAMVWGYIDSFGNLIDWKIYTSLTLPSSYVYDNADHLGSSVCLLQKKDNRYSLALGARGDDDGASKAGAVYILNVLDTCAPLPLPPVEEPIIVCDSTQSEPFQITLGGFENDVAMGVELLKNKSMIVVGYHSKNTVDEDAFVAKIDSNFRIQWQQTYGGSGKDKFYNIAKDENEFLYITGYINNDATIYKMHPSGQLIWQSKINSARVTEFYDVKLFGDKLYLSGVSRSGSSNLNSQDVFIYCLDTNGRRLWSKAYNGGLYESNRHISITPAGDVVLPTMVFNSGQYDPWLMLIDGNNGSTRWSKRINNTNNDGINTAVVHAGAIYCADHYRPNSSNMQGVVYKFDLEGNMIWARHMGNSIPDRVRSITKYNDTLLLVSMFKGSSSNNSLDGNLFLIDTNGNLRYSINIGGNGNDYFNHAIAVNGGEILAVGFTESFGKGKQDIFISKIACSLDTICNSSFYSENVNSFNGSVSNITPSTSDPDDLVVDYTEGQSSDLSLSFICVEDTCLLIPDFNIIDATLCVGDSLVINNKTESSISANYSWILEAPYSNQSDSIFKSIRADYAGDFKIKLIAENSCKQDSIEMMLSIFNLPIVDAGNDTTICMPDTLVLGGESLANNAYSWSPTLGIVDSTMMPTSAIINVPNRYYLRAVDMNTGCVNIDSVEISERNGITIDLGKDTTLCETDTLTIGISDLGSYLWNTGETTQFIQASQSGEYILAFTQSNCTSRDTINISYDSLVVFDLGKDSNLCQDSSLFLNPINYPSDFEYLWNDGSMDSTKLVSTSGTYWLEIMNGKCISRDSIDVGLVVMPQPFDLGPDTSICESDTLRIGFNYSGTYLWNTGSSNSTIQPLNSGLYHVLFTRQGCQLRDSILVQIDNVPSFNIGNDLELCADSQIELSSNVNLPSFTYLWSDGSNGPVLKVNSAGIYGLTIVDGKCSDSATVEVREVPVPQPFDLGMDTIICYGDSLRIGNNQGDDFNYLWNIGTQEREIVISDSGLFRLRIYNQCGAETSEIKVDYEDCSCTIYVPTAFTPNNDQINDEFKASYCEVKSYKMEVFNRWGEKVYEGTNIEEGWDGVYKGKVQAGTYFWIMTIESTYQNNGDPYIRSGNILLLK